MTELFGPRFRTLRHIKTGGMGAVYAVQDTASGATLAIKQKLPTTPKALFRREFDLMAAFDHENVVKGYEYFDSPDCDFYSMEYVPGEPLKDLISRWQGTQSVEVSLLLLLQLARAVQHLHQHQVIHHDLHPWNVLVISPNDRPILKLIDFGTTLRRAEQTAAEIRVGMSNYKSPEQHRGDLLDFTADVYCFGAIAYELLTGQLPFDLKTYDIEGGPMRDFTELRLRAMKAVPAIKNLPRALAVELDRMVQICLEVEPSHRYQSMNELVGFLCSLQRDFAAGPSQTAVSLFAKLGCTFSRLRR